ncbi:MAG: ribose-5-phosphate isomerase RpiA [Candidatus Velthaea sp.]
MQDVDARKRSAGIAAVDRFVRDGMCVGLGTGSTAYWAIRRVGELVSAGASISAVATSAGTAALCAGLQIPLRALLDAPIAVAIDGADEVAPDFALTKGGGGALFREKAVALAAARFVVVVDDRKLVERLGAFPTPVEVVPFAAAWVRQEVDRLAPGVHVRVRGGEQPFRTDNGNIVLDCAFGAISDPQALDRSLKAIHGVVSTGIFCGIASAVIVGGERGAYELERR